MRLVVFQEKKNQKRGILIGVISLGLLFVAVFVYLYRMYSIYEDRVVHKANV